jgi:hypothetical protein
VLASDQTKSLVGSGQLYSKSKRCERSARIAQRINTLSRSDCKKDRDQDQNLRLLGQLLSKSSRIDRDALRRRLPTMPQLRVIGDKGSTPRRNINQSRTGPHCVTNPYLCRCIHHRGARCPQWSDRALPPGTSPVDERRARPIAPSSSRHLSAARLNPLSLNLCLSPGRRCIARTSWPQGRRQRMRETSLAQPFLT